MNKCRRGLTVLVLLCCVLSFTFIGCTSEKKSEAQPNTNQGGTIQEKTQDKSEAKRKVVFWNCDGSPLFQDPLVAMAKRCMAKYPELDIEVVGLPYDSFQQKLDVAVATKTNPDAGYIEINNLPSYIEQGAIFDMNVYFNKWEHKDEFDPRRINWEGFSSDKARYIFPVEFAASSLWYRIDFLKEIGMNAISTWDDFFTAAEKITDKSKNRYGFSMYVKNNGASRMEAYLLAYTGATSYFDENGKCYMRDPRAVEGIAKFVSLYKVNTAESDITSGNADIVNSMIAGSAGLSFINTASYPVAHDALGDGVIGVMMPPAAPNGNKVLNIGRSQGGGIFTIFTNSKDNEAAWLYIAYMLEEDNNSEWCKATGVIPINDKAVAHEWVMNNPGLKSVSECMLNDPKMVQVSSPMFLPEYASIFENIMQAGMQEMLIGTKTAQQYVDDVSTALEEAKAAYDAKKK